MRTASKKVINGWAMYDWANSVYNLVITTTFFPVYYTQMTDAAPFNGVVKFGGRTFVNTALYNYALAFSYMVVAITLPILTSIADYKGNKKRFMQVFCYTGALACSLMYFFTPQNFGLGVICLMVAAFGFYSSLVFYNSYLPEIAEEKDRDRISAKGFSLGYIGSVLMQMIGFALVVFWDKIPFLTGEGHAVRFTFLLVGIWWVGFAQITFRRLPRFHTSQLNGNGTNNNGHNNGVNFLVGGFRELRKVFWQLIQMPVIKRFLLAFFFYNMGVQTVMLAATNFGSKVLKLPSTNLIITVVLIQLVAIAGAFMMSGLSRKYGNLPVLIAVVVFWIGICVAGYYMQTAMHFYLLAVAVGLVMGGIQSLSRSTYAKLMPLTKDTASFFSFYDVSEKVAIVIGLVTFGLIEELTGSMRNSVLSLMVFFLIGGMGLVSALYRQNKEKRLAK
ncbi:MAG: MFS transporter [Chitinophagaceae bacterium]|nr:MFS transporter [Chitinophagaceae bacterium]MCZ2395853.1 MFS transporter [Chitinophagales bacterium]